MSQFYDDVVASETIYFWFASNDATGTGADGATPLYDVRLGGAAAGAAPTASGTPTLLTHADYLPGSYEIGIDTTGYANGHYGVFSSLTISAVNPGGFVGSFRVRTANRVDGLVSEMAKVPKSDSTVTWNATALASVKTQAVAALNTDTYAEPTGVPAATATLVSKIGRLHQALRNAVTVTATKKQFFDDAGAALWEKDLSDDATTYTETEANSV